MYKLQFLNLMTPEKGWEDCGSYMDYETIEDAQNEIECDRIYQYCIGEGFCEYRAVPVGGKYKVQLSGYNDNHELNIWYVMREFMTLETVYKWISENKDDCERNNVQYRIEELK